MSSASAEDSIRMAGSLVQLLFCAAGNREIRPSGEEIADACNLIHGFLNNALDDLKAMRESAETKEQP